MQSALLALGAAVPQDPNFRSIKFWDDAKTVKEIHLSMAQIPAIEQIYDEFTDGSPAARKKLNSQEILLKSLTYSSNPDIEALAKQSEIVVQAQKEFMTRFDVMVAAIELILTEVQKKKLDEIQVTSRRTAFPLYQSLYKSTANYDESLSGETISPPKVLIMYPPLSTPEARTAKIAGTVLVRVNIKEDGTVGSAEIIKGLGYGLDELAIDTITKKWKFSPGTRNGTPVKSTTTIKIMFGPPR